ncbi:MAG: dihydrodipicolinate synthase family protein [Fimbriimonadaceae bacterium]
MLAPLVTPFTDDASTVSEVRLARLMRWYRESGVEGVVVGTPAGEFASLSLTERRQVLDWVTRDAGDLAVYVNVTAQTTAVTIDLCQDAAENGAVGAILCPPMVGQLSLEEGKNYLTVVRRFGNLSVGFIDPTGKLADVAHGVEETTAKCPGTLADHELTHFALTAHGGSTECWTPSGMVHPVAIFGKDRAEAILGKWGAFRPVLDGVLRHSGLARVGKYVSENNGIEVGPLRGPFMPLNQTGREVVDHILKAI